jgi:transcriptional regulator with XRE-family HTH domain
MILKMKAERLRRNWTQTDLGFHAGLSASDISRIESGRNQPYPGHATKVGLNFRPMAEKVTGSNE